MAKEAKRPRIPDDALNRLALCWLRAELMHKHLCDAREAAGPELERLKDSEQRMPFLITWSLGCLPCSWWSRVLTN